MGVGCVRDLLRGRAVSGISCGGGLCQGSPMGVSCVRDLLWGWAVSGVYYGGWAVPGMEMIPPLAHVLSL